MAEYRYTVLFEPAEEGGYVAFCPAKAGAIGPNERAFAYRYAAEFLGVLPDWLEYKKRLISGITQFALAA